MSKNWRSLARPGSRTRPVLVVAQAVQVLVDHAPVRDASARALGPTPVRGKAPCQAPGMASMVQPKAHLHLTGAVAAALVGVVPPWALWLGSVLHRPPTSLPLPIPVFIAPLLCPLPTRSHQLTTAVASLTRRLITINCSISRGTTLGVAEEAVPCVTWALGATRALQGATTPKVAGTRCPNHQIYQRILESQ